MKTKTLQILSLIIGICGAILATADQIAPIAAINPMVAHYWPIVFAASMAVSRVAAILADHLKKTQ